MLSKNRIKWWTGLLVIAAALLLVAPMAIAGSNSDEIEALKNRLEQLESQVDDDTGKREFEMASKWLAEAEEFHAQGTDQAVTQRIRRVDHALDLLRALTDTKSMEASIERQLEAYDRSQERVESLKSDIQSLEKQKQEREAELQRIQDSE